MSTRVGIIGAGVAGLSTAYFLEKQGYETRVYEAAPVIGGLASTIALEPGLEIERFYHFICGPDRHLLELAEALGLGAKLHWRPTLMSFYHGGALHPFGSPVDLLRFKPLSLRDRVRVGLHVLRSRRLHDWRSLDAISAVEWLKAEIGEEAYRVIWEPLLEMKFGPRHQDISAAWIWSRIARVARSRRGFRQVEMLGYLEGGTGTLLHALAEKIQGEIRVGTPVQEVMIEGDRVTGLRLEDGEEAHDIIVSTVPLRLLARLAPGLAPAYRDQLEHVEYLGVTCLLLRLKRPFGPYFWTNISDSNIPFAGIIEYTRLNSMPALGGDSLIYIPHYLPSEDPRFEWTLEDALREYVPALQKVNPAFRPTDVVEAWMNRAAHAQVVCRLGFSSLVPPFHAPAAGLYLTDSTQLYPEDRVISDLIRCAEEVASLVTRNYPHP